MDGWIGGFHWFLYRFIPIEFMSVKITVFMLPTCELVDSQFSNRRLLTLPTRVINRGPYFGQGVH